MESFEFWAYTKVVANKVTSSHKNWACNRDGYLFFAFIVGYFERLFLQGNKLNINLDRYLIQRKGKMNTKVNIVFTSGMYI